MGRMVLSKAWNSGTARDPQFQRPGVGAPPEARHPQGWTLRLGVSSMWRIPGCWDDRSALRSGLDCSLVQLGVGSRPISSHGVNWSRSCSNL
eukprot:14886409-Alexandrium_andersonii.AAC.1